MGYYSDFYILDTKAKRFGSLDGDALYTFEDNLKYIGSADGSDVPGYMENIRSEAEFRKVLKEFADDETRGYWEGIENYPWPWRDSHTSDWMFILKPTGKRWWEFWKPEAVLYVGIKIDWAGKKPNWIDIMPFDLHQQMDYEDDFEYQDKLVYYLGSIEAIELPNLKILKAEAEKLVE